jgi:glycosyltransferase involved in cell wall biosynthesis
VGGLNGIGVSVITPVAGEHARFLPSLWDSLVSQCAPGGWEWLIQDDGHGEALGAVPERAAADERVWAQCLGRPGGVAAARNLALVRASGRVVLPLDADDYLVAGALMALAAPVVAGDAAWAAPASSRVVDLDGGTVEERTSRIPVGEVTPGVVRSYWNANGNPFPPNIVAYRTTAVWEVGGWPAAVVDEDVGLLLRVSDHHPGVVVDAEAVRQRRWPGQVTANADALACLFAAQRVFHHLSCQGTALPVAG